MTWLYIFIALSVLFIAVQVVLFCLKVEKKYLAVVPMINSLILIVILIRALYAGDSSSAFNFSFKGAVLYQVIALLIAAITTGILFSLRKDENFVDIVKEKKKAQKAQKAQAAREEREPQRHSRHGVYDPEGEDILRELRELKKSAAQGGKDGDKGDQSEQ